MRDDRYEEEDARFRDALTAWFRAGDALINAWDGEVFHADETYPLPKHLTPPMSLDEWFAELEEHYQGFAEQEMSR